MLVTARLLQSVKNQIHIFIRGSRRSQPNSVGVYRRVSVHAEPAVSPVRQQWGRLHYGPVCRALLLHMVAVMAVICKELEK